MLHELDLIDLHAALPSCLPVYKHLVVLVRLEVFIGSPGHPSLLLNIVIRVEVEFNAHFVLFHRILLLIIIQIRSLAIPLFHSGRITRTRIISKTAFDTSIHTRGIPLQIRILALDLPIQATIFVFI